MKITVIPALALLATVFSCNMDTADHTREISRMEDSVFASFPTVNRVTIKVSSEFSKQIHVTLGDKQLYNANEEERNKVVARTKEIIKNIFNERAPAKGEVSFSEEENKITTENDPVKKYPIVLKEE